MPGVLHHIGFVFVDGVGAHLSPAEVLDQLSKRHRLLMAQFERDIDGAHFVAGAALSAAPRPHVAAICQYATVAQTGFQRGPSVTCGLSAIARPTLETIDVELSRVGIMIVPPVPNGNEARTSSG